MATPPWETTVLPTLHLAAPSDIPRRVIVFFRGRVTPDDVASLRREGAEIRHAYSIIPAVAGTLSEILIAKLSEKPRITRIAEDRPVQVLLDLSVPQIRADRVHTLGTTGSGAKVCIVDTGVDDSHSALPALIAERDFVNGDDDASDDHGHGTHVAGIVASRDATYGGVAPGASLLAAKVLDQNGSGFTSDVIAGVEWCVAQAADVINLSLGGGLFFGACDSDPLANACNSAVDQGTTVAAASGNNGLSFLMVSPACASKVIAVGAVDGTDILASFSNGGTELDLVAPGVGIDSTYPGGSFRRLSGTSMATPHVAGVAALLLEADPTLGPASIHTTLRQTAKDLGPRGFDTRYGFGRVDAEAAHLAVVGAASSSLASSSLSSQASSLPSSSSSTPSSSSVASSSVFSSTSSAAPLLLFREDFESGTLDAWTESGDPSWTVEAPAERQVPGKGSGNRVAHADRCRSAGGCTLTLKDAVDASGLETLTLRFWRYVDRSLDAGEFLRVDAFDGTTWNTLAAWTDGSGDDDRWHEEEFDLPSQYRTSSFRIRFVTRESSSLEEVEIDDVLLLGN